MKTGYKIENNIRNSTYEKCILVSNYEGINQIVNLPCQENSVLLTGKRCSRIGVWRIKQTNQNIH